MIEILCLGGFRVRRDGAELTRLAAHKQQAALLAYLAVEGPVTRDALIVLFWPEREGEKARHSLSQALYALRKELGEEALQARGDRVGLNPEVDVDVKALAAAGRAELWREVVELYRGPFLERFQLAQAAGFEEWRTRTRAWVGRLARKAFAKLIAALCGSGDVAAARETAQRWAELEPLEDEAQHALIATLAMLGDRSAALEHYEAHRKLLERELEVKPLEATVALVEQIRAGARPRSPLLTETILATPAAPGAAAGEIAAGVAVEIDSLVKRELAPRLEVLRMLGASATARVYLAREPKLGRRVAVKLFAPQLASDRRARQRFERGVQAIASLAHPNIAALLWAGALSNGLPYFVMQYVEGESLAEKVRVEGRLSVPDARRVIAEIASALDAAHRRGIVHRDVQPANVRYDEETGRALLTDFGVAALLSRAEEPAVRITESGELVGDPAWMSPEQLKGDEATERSDIYSLGLLGYYLLTEESPFVTGSRRALYSAQLGGEPRGLAELRPDVDTDLERTLAECLAKEPRRRPSALELARTLARPASEQDAAGRPPRGLVQHLANRRVPQWLAVYLAGGFGTLELVEQLTGRGLLSGVAYDLSLATYLIGIPAAALLAWFHGRLGRQRFQPIEYWLLGTLALVWLAVGGAILLR